MSNSSLVTKFITAHTSNYTKGRSAKISEITIHHMAGNLSIEQLGKMWQEAGRVTSSHYGVQGKQIGQYVKEEDVAYTNGDGAANTRAVTIEVANNGGAPNWPVSDDTLDTLIKLVADIAKRNNLVPLVLKKNLTWHSLYFPTQCPGPYLLEKLPYIVEQANKPLGANSPLYRVRQSPDDGETQLGAFKELEGAKKVADENVGYKVYDSTGKLVYAPTTGGGTVSQQEYDLLLAELEKEVFRRKEAEGTIEKINKLSQTVEQKRFV